MDGNQMKFKDTPRPIDLQSQSSEDPENETYTKEQFIEICRVLKSQDYYEVLLVSKDASASDIKEAYRRLLRLLHPDKNLAPGATQAFQELSKAGTVLLDPVERKKYDEEQHALMASEDVQVPTFVVAGGVVLIAAGLLGMWWSSRSKKKPSEGDRGSRQE